MTHHFRSDYREFLELALLFLGEKLEKKDHQVIFHPPGADHHARWMSKAIYCLKIFMFRHQLNLGTSNLDGLRQITIFLIKHYLKAWFRCPIGSEAPFQDFNFIKSMLLDKDINQSLAYQIIKTFSRHLWYLEEQTVGLAFFDESIPIEIRNEMVARLDDENEDDIIQNGHRVVAKPDTIQRSYLTQKFSDFFNASTLQFFERFHISTDFLKEPVETWNTSESYRSGFEIVKQIKVTNDTAERTVQLMTNFVGILTKDDNNYQELLAVVEEYHKIFPTYRKKDLA